MTTYMRGFSSQKTNRFFSKIGEIANIEGPTPSSDQVNVSIAIQTVYQNQIRLGSMSTGANCHRMQNRPEVTKQKVQSSDAIVAEEIHLKSIAHLKKTLTYK